MGILAESSADGRAGTLFLVRGYGRRAVQEGREEGRALNSPAAG
jgi:hypothetical protein